MRHGMGIHLLNSILILMVGGSAAAASVSGVVLLTGEPPTPDEVIQMTGDRRCQHDGDITTERWKLSDENELAEVVVYLKSGPVAETAGDKPVIDQVQCRYTPHVTAVQVGEPIEVRNSDPTFHNVRGNRYEGPRSIGRDLFNFGQPTQGMKRDIQFDEPGVYRLKCDVHPWMRAWVLVAESSYFDVTDAEGRFQLPEGLGEGEYVLKAWHHQFLEPLEQTIEISGEPVEVVFEFDPANALPR